MVSTAPLLLAAVLDTWMHSSSGSVEHGPGAGASSCYFHPNTGLELPAAPAPMTCESEPLECTPDEFTTRYVGMDRSELTLSLFVYRRVAPCSSPDETPEEHLAGVRSAAAQGYTDLVCQSWKPEGPRRMVGLKCRGDSPELGGRMVTFIGLEAMKGWWFKIRATMSEKNEAVGEQRLRTVLRGIRRHRPTAP